MFIDFPICGYMSYFWASLVTQLVKNSPAMQETWVRSLGWDDNLEKGKATQFGAAMNKAAIMFL